MKNSMLKLVSCFFIGFIILSGCASSKLSDDFAEDDVKKATEEVISYINNEDSEAILEMSNAEMKDALTDEVLQEVYSSINESGKFEKIEDISISGKEEIAVAVAKTKYENNKIIYTVSFNKEMKIAGLFYK